MRLKMCQEKCKMHYLTRHKAGYQWGNNRFYIMKNFYKTDVEIVEFNGLEIDESQAFFVW